MILFITLSHNWLFIQLLDHESCGGRGFSDYSSYPSAWYTVSAQQMSHRILVLQMRVSGKEKQVTYTRD